MNLRRAGSHLLTAGLLLTLPFSVAVAEENPEGPAEPAPESARPASTAAPKSSTAPKGTDAQKPPGAAGAAVAVKSTGKKMTLSLVPPKVAPAPANGAPVPPQTTPQKPVTPVAAKPAASLKLAPSAAEIESERKANPPPPPKERDPRDATPKQNPNWPTHVDNSRGPGSTTGPGTAVDRKGMMQEVSGPQQGVIRNRW